MSLSKIRRVAALVFGLLLCSNAFAQHVDTSTYAILPYTTQMDWIFPVGSKAASLSPAEIDTAERILHTCIENYNVEQQRRFEKVRESYPDVRKRDYVIDIARGKRQYVCAICPDGEKLVWINYLCCCIEDFDYRTSIIGVDDGGNCYFTVKINLIKKQYFGFQVNGN